MSSTFKVFAAVAAAAMLGGCIVIPIADLLQPMPLRETLVERGESSFFSAPKIVIVDVQGTITGAESGSLLGSRESTVHEVQDRFRRIRSDPDVVGVILRISSPGGEVTACDVIREEILRLKKSRRLPVVACIVDTGASGGYYIATAADSIIAHPTSVVGSIGVILQSVNVTDLFEKIGVSMLTVKSGEFKDLASPFRSSSEEEIDVLENVVGELHERFVEVVDEGRARLSRAEVDALADGKIYTGTRARELGLVDATGYMKDAVDEARRRSGEPRAAVVRYARADRPGANLYSLRGDTPPARADDVSIQISASRGPSARFLYLWVP